MKGFEKTSDLLFQLSEVGRPSVSKMEQGGWHAQVDFPSPKGVTAKVRSGFDHKTPDDALQVCIDRLGGMQDMISVKSPVPNNVFQLEQSQ